MECRNPVIRGFNPDPSICYDGEYYYLVTSSFEFFPGVPIYKSRDMIHWNHVGHCLTRQSQCNLENAKNSGGIYAPTIRYFRNKYYMVTTNVSDKGHLIVSSDDPEVEWSDPIWVKQGIIDPSLLFEDNTVYFVSNDFINGRSCIVMCEINIDTGEKVKETKIISYGSGGRCVEAPHLYKINNWYYLMMAEGGTEYGHMITIFRSRSPYGPYESCPWNPILSHRDHPMSSVQCVGHGDLICDRNGKWKIVCLGVRTLDSVMLHNLGRETFLVSVEWKDGWPIVGENKMIPPNPKTNHIRSYENKFHDNFSTNTFDPAWTWIRNPDMDLYKVEKGSVYLTGKGIHLFDSGQSPSFMGIRQTEFDSCTTVDLLPVEENTVAGIAAYYNTEYYYVAYIKNRKDHIVVCLSQTIHGQTLIVNEISLPLLDSCRLSLNSNQKYYEFSIWQANHYYYLGKCPTVGLCTEGTMSMTFTGVFIGIFCEEGKGKFSAFDHKVIIE